MEIERCACDRSLAVAGEQLCHIADSSTEPGAALLTQQMAVFLHQGSAPRAVHDDRLVAISESLDVGASQDPRLVEQAGVGMESSAASLTGDLASLVAIDAQGALGGLMDVGEETLLDAAAKQLGGTGRYGAVRGGRSCAPSTAVYRLIPPPIALRCHQHSERKPDPAPPSDSPREHRSQSASKPIHDAAHTRRGQRPYCRAREQCGASRRSDSSASRFEAVAVLHARGAHRLAGAAAEAAIEMIDECRIGHGEIAALERPHQLDAAARRVGLIASSEKCRTGLKAEPTVHARVQPFETESPFRHVPSVATTSAPPGSNVRLSPATSGPTPSRYAPK